MCFCANEGASRSKCAELHADAYVISRIYYEIYCFYAITKNMGSAYAHCKKGQAKGHGDEGSKAMCAKRGDAFRGRCDGKRTGKIKQGGGVSTEETFVGHFDFAKHFELLLLCPHAVSVASYGIFELRRVHQFSVGLVDMFLLCKGYGNVKTGCFL